MEESTTEKSNFFYPNGQLMESVEKKHGESHGKFQSFYPNGQLKEEGVYVFGAKQGEWKSYHHNGKLSRKRVMWIIMLEIP